MSETIRLKARCIKCCFKKDDYRIMSWSPIDKNDKIKLSDYFTFSTKGNDSYIDENKDYEIEVEEISYDKRYGGTYKIISVPSLSNFDVSALSLEEKKEILMDCTTSERIADNILEAYPDFIKLILTQGKEAIDVKKVKGMGEAYLSSYSRNLLEKYKYLGIINHFKDYKLDVSDCKQLISEYTDEETIAKEIKNNPYKVLISVLHRSFEFADRMIMEIRPDLKVSETRCAYLILSVLERNEQDGSTRLNGNDLYCYILEQYNVPELEPLIVPVAKNNELFYYDEKSKDLSVMTTYLGECAIKDFVLRKIEESNKLDIDWMQYMDIDGFKLSDKQGSALKMFCDYNFMILAGFSGSGKTSALKGLIKLIESNGMSYTLLAPSGKASRRITESTNRKASTIHLKCLRDKEISTDVLIVDECSMIDLPTFLMMLHCIENPNIRVVLVGDPAQINPIGIGCIFADLIASGKVPIIMLTEVFRYNTSGALFVATNVRQGRKFFDNDIVKRNGNEYTVCDNYKFIQTNNIFEEVVKQYNALISRGVKPNDILCLSPFNVGDEGTYRINNTIQAEINTPKPNEVILSRKVDKDKTNVVFRVGDKVLNKKNDYKALPYDSWQQIEESCGKLTSADVPVTSIFNGQEGIVREVDDKRLVVQFDEELIVFDKSKLVNLLLGYCISIHASQGSEAKYVINVVSPVHSRMLNRNLLYVADTRSKIMQIDIGDTATYNDALLIDGNNERNTWLLELLTEGDTTNE